MLSFSPFSQQRGEWNGHRTPRLNVATDDAMDVFEDEEGLLSRGSKLTYPGESLVSSHECMRYVYAPEASWFIVLHNLINWANRGHGTYVDGEEVVASVAGTIERVNKLVTVRAIRTR